MIIAISGKAGSGKDTVGTFIYKCLTSAKRTNIPFVFHFADTLKESLSHIFNCPIEEFYRNKNGIVDGFNFTYREAMQKYGTAIRDLFGDDVWAKALFKGYDPKFPFIICDLRYKSELEYIKKKDPNAILIRVNRPGIKLMNHESEIDLDSYKDWNYIIDNNGTLEELEYKCSYIVDDILSK